MALTPEQQAMEAINHELIDAVKKISPMNACEIARELWEIQKEDFNFADSNRSAFVMGVCYGVQKVQDMLQLNEGICQTK